MRSEPRSRRGRDPGRRLRLVPSPHACLVVTIAAMVWAGTAASAATVRGNLDIYVLNVGQGDAVLVRCPHRRHWLLIDAGAHSYPGSQQAFHQQLLELAEAGSTLDVVVATHPHEDHIGGMVWVLDTYKVRKFIDSGLAYSALFADLPAKVRQEQRQGLKYFAAAKTPASRVADFCPATNLTAEVLVPEGFGRTKSPNNNSVVILITYNRQRLLFTGDAEKSEETLLLADPTIAPKLQRVAFYKVGHHGSETSSTPALLSAMAPDVVAMSSGCKNVAKNKNHRHPRAATLRALVAAMPAGAGKEVRRVPAGSTTAWTTVTVHRGIYATSVDDSILIRANGTSISKVASELASAPGACHP